MFSLIRVDITANIDKFEASLAQTANIAEASLSAAAAHADAFQTAFDRAAAGVDESAKRMAGNLEAANDRAVEAAQATVSSIDGVAKAADRVDVQSWPEKLSAALVAGFASAYAEARTAMERISDFVRTQLIIVGVAIATGITVATVGAIYAAFRIVSESLSFVKGLFTGESYQSENIDAVIALNKEVRLLQDGLRVSAEHASGLNEALKGLGLDSRAYVATLEAAARAQRTNTDELDRLGIAYRDANSELLSQAAFLKNVKAALDEYAAGYDRNAAAAAIAAGSYEAIAQAVSVTDETVAEATQRLVDYNLVIGPRTQDAVSAYEAAMRAFQRETDLTAQGFRKAIADQILPLLTDLATFFKDGFPVVVNAFRYSMATLVSLFYGLKEVAFLVSEAVIQSFKAMGDVVSRVVGAIAKAATGNVEGAWNDLKAVPDDLGKRWTAFGDAVVAQSTRNARAMALAWGADNFGPMTPDPAKTGKPWTPRPPAEAEPRAGRSPVGLGEPESPYEQFLEQLDQMTARLDSNQYTMFKVRAAQLAWNEGLSATVALEKIAALQTAESEKAVRDYGTRVDEQNRRLLESRGAIGLYGLELEVYQMKQQRRADVLGRINQLEAAGKPLTDAMRDALLGEASAAEEAAEAILRQNDALSRTFEVGAKRAFDAYLDRATNAARTAEEQFTAAYQSIEQALADCLFNPFERGVQGMLVSFGQAIQRMIAQAVAADLGRRIFGAIGSPGSGGLFDSLFGWIGLGGASAPLPGSLGAAGGLPLPSFAVGTDYVPRDMIAQIHQGERIIPAAQNTGGFEAPVNITVHVHGQSQAPDVRRSAGQGAREALAVLKGMRRYG
ncbi:phage tail tape measure C-terminal domain-containing protein [Accumulibacter sp.]|uniref:phage tail tape measure C-terminal domain-containing protein n=1 Tax=Accumulibacter sp. TaxID=2053492 RepID=UPI0025D8D3FE|nr:phage tail tape measure C-terminal domain-containing protein [Accumulibacter sp.]MCM8596655.1 hypothetical protein [Accumulibacter sp.]MCM8625963.1 hypothetical protein [Accumulibacter sp.]MDS4050803.1 phage tail tape measure C-terminal domain-containing protein [Accumulibacter sp.]